MRSTPGTPSAFFLVPQNPLSKHFSNQPIAINLNRKKLAIVGIAAYKPLAPYARARDSSARTRAHLCWLTGTNITTMASYATIPAEAETEKPLLNRDVRVNLKTVIGGAAVASFVLGALAAAVVSGPARTNSAALYAHSGYQLNAQTPMAFSSGLLKDGAHCKGDNFCASGDCHKGHQDQKYWRCKESHSHKYDDVNKHCTRDSDCGGNAPHCTSAASIHRGAFAF